MVENRWQRAVAILSVACFLVTSCTSLENVSIPSAESPPARPPVKVGDKVEVTTRTTKTRFKVTAVEADSLVGVGKRVAYADMATLDIVHIRKGPTIAIVLLATYVVLSLIATSQAEDAIEEVFAQPVH